MGVIIFIVCVCVLHTSGNGRSGIKF